MLLRSWAGSCASGRLAGDDLRCARAWVRGCVGACVRLCSLLSSALCSLLSSALSPSFSSPLSRLSPLAPRSLVLARSSLFAPRTSRLAPRASRLSLALSLSRRNARTPTLKPTRAHHEASAKPTRAHRPRALKVTRAQVPVVEPIHVPHESPHPREDACLRPARTRCVPS